MTYAAGVLTGVVCVIVPSLIILLIAMWFAPVVEEFGEPR